MEKIQEKFLEKNKNFVQVDKDVLKDFTNEKLKEYEADPSLKKVFLAKNFVKTGVLQVSEIVR